MLFLADRSALQERQLHNRIKNHWKGDLLNERVTRASLRDPGSYRVIGEVDPQGFLDDPSYPTSTARLEIGFQLRTPDSYEHYWINWIEPDRNLLVGWHQDDDHDDLGPVHLQVNDGDSAVDHQPAHFIDEHPQRVVEQRISELPTAIKAVQWGQSGRPTSFDTLSSVIASAKDK